MKKIIDFLKSEGFFVPFNHIFNMCIPPRVDGACINVITSRV